MLDDDRRGTPMPRTHTQTTHRPGTNPNPPHSIHTTGTCTVHGAARNTEHESRITRGTHARTVTVI